MTREPETAPIRELLVQAAQSIPGETPRLDAEVLLACVLDKPRSHLLAWPEKQPSAEQQARFHALVDRRIAGEPVAHLVGQREFWSLPLAVTPDTLIPRPETETLVACALEALPVNSHADIADLGTGSGAIALAIAHERPGSRLLATDSSAAALEVAAANARRLGLDNIEFVNGSWCEALGDRQFDLIVSNPPYIPEADPHLGRGDVRFEPRTALAAGSDGLDDLRRIAGCAYAHLRKNARLMLEHGFYQAEPVRRILEENGYRDITGYRDMAGQPRVTAGSR